MSQQQFVQRYSQVKTPFIALVLSVAMAACGEQRPEPANASSAATEKPVEVAPTPPMDVLGVTIGQPLTLPRCKHRAGDFPKQKCWSSRDAKGEVPQANDYVTVDFPYDDLPKGILNMSVAIKDGNVYDIDLDTMEVFQVDIQKMLVDKWGKPTQANVTDLQNGFGATFQSIESHWVFPQMRMLFLGRSYGDEGSIIFQSLPRPEEPKKPTSL